MRIWGLGLRIWGLGLRIWGLGLRIRDLGLRVQGFIRSRKRVAQGTQPEASSWYSCLGFKGLGFIEIVKGLGANNVLTETF